MQKRAVAINDISCYGRCALTVTLPVLSAAGVECAIVPTVVLSTHLAYPAPVIHSMTDSLAGITDHFKSIGAEFDAIAIGYLNDAAQTALIMDFIDKFKSDKTIILADPTMADHGKMYGNPAFDRNFLEGMRNIVKKSDYTVPNITEAAFLCGLPFENAPHTKEYIEKLLYALAELGPKYPVVTGIAFEDSKIGSACLDSKTGRISYSFAKKFEGRFIGTGDLFAAAFLGAVMNGFSPEASCESAAAFVSYSIEKSLKVNTPDSMAINFEQSLPFYMKKLDIIS